MERNMLPVFHLGAWGMDPVLRASAVSSHMTKRIWAPDLYTYVCFSPEV